MKLGYTVFILYMTLPLLIAAISWNQYLNKGGDVVIPLKQTVLVIIYGGLLLVEYNFIPRPHIIFLPSGNIIYNILYILFNYGVRFVICLLITKLQLSELEKHKA